MSLSPYVYAYCQVVRRYNAGRSLRRRRKFFSESARSHNLLQWAVGLQQLQRRRRLFVLKEGHSIVLPASRTAGLGYVSKPETLRGGREEERVGEISRSGRTSNY